ncbi:MAG: hypothetical protein Q7R87_03815 [Nanoarchaeota archaeon]|nr:hypothetical protein [Nanoarchaeota archaeon]
MTLAHYVISYFKRGLFALIAIVVVYFCIIFAGAGAVMNSKIIIFLALFIGILVFVSMKYLYWKNKVGLQTGTVYQTRHRNY